MQQVDTWQFSHNTTCQGMCAAKKATVHVVVFWIVTPPNNAIRYQCFRGPP